jgi:hypothetical protein
LRTHGSGWVALAIAAFTIPSLSMTTFDYFVRYATHPDLARDFYLDDWRMGQYAATQPPDTVLYLTPTQEEMATIYFALADPDRLRSYNGQGGIIPAGIPDQPVLYLLRPDASETLTNLGEFFSDNGTISGGKFSDYIPFHVPADAERVPNPIPDPVDFGGEIHLTGWSFSTSPDQLDVMLTWQTVSSPSKDYTAFVHLVNQAGELVAQTDRPPAGFPTGDWRPGEVVIDIYRVNIPAHLSPGDYQMQTGFYHLPTMERLGEGTILGTLHISDSTP